MTIQELNQLEPVEAFNGFYRCCGSKKWAALMERSRPFSDFNAIESAAEEHANRLSEEDWLEAFSHHPMIGDSVEDLRKKFTSTADWSAGEQEQVGEAKEETLVQLAENNRAYYAKFGFIFIVCATGKSAAEMLKLLQARLPNDKVAEVKNAAEEQRKITLIRLNKWIS